LPGVTKPRLLTLAIAACAALNLRALFAGDLEQVYLFKPLTTILIGVLAATGEPGAHASRRAMVLAGLACSLAGDVFLMLPGDLFVAGLASFLVAHLFYIAAFTRDGWRASPWPPTLCGTYVMVLMWWSLPRAGEVRLPVALYGLVIGAMAWQAIERWRALPAATTLAAAAGAVLFVLSDSALAINRFVAPFALAPLAVMGTYVPAQLLIALSAGRGRI
jgi:uncharacterized membrane protein YhhN